MCCVMLQPYPPRVLLGAAGILLGAKAHAGATCRGGSQAQATCGGLAPSRGDVLDRWV